LRPIELSRPTVDHSAVIASSGGTSAYASDIGEEDKWCNVVSTDADFVAFDYSRHLAIILSRNDWCTG
jgi:hypothetical protein